MRHISGRTPAPWPHPQPYSQPCPRSILEHQNPNPTTSAHLHLTEPPSHKALPNNPLWDETLKSGVDTLQLTLVDPPVATPILLQLHHPVPTTAGSNTTTPSIPRNAVPRLPLIFSPTCSIASSKSSQPTPCPTILSAAPLNPPTITCSPIPTFPCKLCFC